MRIAFISLAGVLAWASPAYADEASSTPDIIVTAARGTALKDMDVSTTVVNTAEIEATPATATDQIINRIPGVFTLNQPAAALHPTGDTFSIRGFGTTTNVNTLVMLDGIPMNDPYFRVVDWNQITKAQIASIEVIRGGGATSLWGNMAMGGVVNIVSKPPEAGHIDFDTNVGSYHTLSGTATAGVALAKDVVGGISVSDTTSDGYNKTPEAYRSPYMAATASSNVNVDASIHATPSANTSLFVTALWHQLQEHDLVWALTQNRWQTYRISAGGETVVAGGKLALTGWYGGGAMNTTNVSEHRGFSIFVPAVGEPYVSQTENATYHNVGGSLVWQTSLGALHGIKLGVDGRSLEANDPLQLFAFAGQAGTQIATAASGNLLAHAQHHFEGVFAQATFAPVTLPLEITLGLRGDFWQTSNGSLSGNYLGSNFADTIANQSYARFDPRIGAKFRLADGVALRGAAYRNFAAPGMNQMYRSFISGTSYTTVNPGLRPQTNVGEEVGIDLTGSGALAGLTLSATAYSDHLKHFIDYATVQSGCAVANNYCGTGISGINTGNLSQYVNAGNATLRGFEVLGAWTLGAMSLQGGFTYTDAHLTSSAYTTPSAGVIPDPTGQQLGQVPKWLATAGAHWRLTPRLAVDATVKSFPAYWNATSHNQRNDGATIVDLGASWQVRRGLELYTSLQNVGNVHYLDQGYGVTTSNGSVVKGSTVPALGLPFWATFGLRAQI